MASLVLCLVPGPDMIYLLARSIAQGRKAGYIAAVGINAGAYVHLFAAVIGLSAILATSSLAFTIVKWLGAAYLVFIGLQAIMNKSRFNIETNTREKTNGKQIFWQGFLSDVLNPKVALFFLAFLPQFVQESGLHPTWQLLILGFTVNIIGILVSLCLVYFSTLVTQGLRNNDFIKSWLQKIAGTVFIALGIKLASEKAS